MRGLSPLFRRRCDLESGLAEDRFGGGGVRDCGPEDVVARSECSGGQGVVKRVASDVVPALQGRLDRRQRRKREAVCAA